jgi:hypothetical protein
MQPDDRLPREFLALIALWLAAIAVAAWKFLTIQGVL